ncbi:TRAP transporter large permease [Salipaludibacillus aurantiacus]|uniref:TRAP transporter, DctM subunit n=1 Tax=Salipaludibacillus aurantiacus TaxID=1601833 RepID=A0A1H9W2D4_9BACI|nr:TRAP transporter large permease subunit [Salipaludibacillus aurantiacus]SES28065.1 TRAP transporter, DctM subunit [Salipaludibacillus aurantiacus]
MTLVIFLVALMFFILIGVPIAFSLLLSGISLMIYMDLFSTQLLSQNLLNGVNNFPLMAVPFFILAGELMNKGGLSQRIIDFSMTLFGHVRGGMGYVAILACLLFAGLSGSAVADVAALGAILIPMMVKAGYDRNKSSGLIAAGGIIAPMIPPSVSMILFGVTGGVSISQLFIAGIVPGIMMAVMLTITWWLIMRKDTTVQTFEKKPLKEMIISSRHALWALFLPVIIVVGLRGGIFTPTEAAVIAVAYAFFVGFFIYKELKLKHLYSAFLVAAKMTSIVLFLAAAALYCAWLITVANIPRVITEFLGPFIQNPLLLLTLIIVIVIVVGTVMDVTPMILILTPLLMPVVLEAGINPVYFGVIFILANSIGLLTPPVGTVLNVACGVGKIGMVDIVKGIWPFLIAHVVVLILLLLFPGIILVPLNFLF